VAKSKVTIEIDADEAKAGREFAKMEKRLARAEAKLKKMGRAGKQAGKDIESAGKRMKDAFGAKALSDTKNLAIGIVGVGTAVAGVRTVVRLMMTEIQHNLEQQRKARQSILSLAAAEDELMKNLGGSAAERTAMIATAAAIAKETSQPQKTITLALADAISALGDKDTAIKAVRLSARYQRSKPELIADFAGTIGDVSIASRGLSGGKLDPLLALGVISQTSRKSRVTSQRFLGEHVPKALIGAVAQGATVAGASALFSTVTTETGGKKGAETKTAEIRFTGQLAKFGMKPLTQQVPLSPALQKWAGMEFGEQMAFLRANPELAAKVTAQIPAKMKKTRKGLTPEFAAQFKGMDLAGRLGFIEQNRRLVGEDVIAGAPGIAGTKTFAAIPGWKQMTMKQRLNFIQRDPERAAAFDAGLTLEASVEAPFRALVTKPGGAVAKKFEKHFAEFPDAQGLRDVARTQIKALDIPKRAVVGKVQRASDSARERLLLANQEGALLATIRDGVVGALEDSGKSKFTTDLAALSLDIDPSTGERPGASKALRMLRGRARELLHPTAQRAYVASGGFGSVTRVPVPSSELATERGNVMNEYADKLDLILEKQAAREFDGRSARQKVLVSPGEDK
jgi:hypothetical protein